MFLHCFYNVLKSKRALFICSFLFGFVCSECFGTVLKQLLNDLTRPEITACSELNLLPPLCYSQDLALLGLGLQDMDQHYIEEQVSTTAMFIKTQPHLLFLYYQI